MGLFGDRGLPKLGKEASAFRMVAGAVRDRLQELDGKGRGPEGLDCLRNAFQGAGSGVRAKADEFLGASEPLLSEATDR
jgi:hypothetical protein